MIQVMVATRVSIADESVVPSNVSFPGDANDGNFFHMLLHVSHCAANTRDNPVKRDSSFVSQLLWRLASYAFVEKLERERSSHAFRHLQQNSRTALRKNILPLPAGEL
jgi:hypothetical protein